MIYLLRAHEALLFVGAAVGLAGDIHRITRRSSAVPTPVDLAVKASAKFLRSPQGSVLCLVSFLYGPQLLSKLFPPYFDGRTGDHLRFRIRYAWDRFVEAHSESAYWGHLLRQQGWLPTLLVARARPLFPQLIPLCDKTLLWLVLSVFVLCCRYSARYFYGPQYVQGERGLRYLQHLCPTKEEWQGELAKLRVSGALRRPNTLDALGALVKSVVHNSAPEGEDGFDPDLLLRVNLQMLSLRQRPVPPEINPGDLVLPEQLNYVMLPEELRGNPVFSARMCPLTQLPIRYPARIVGDDHVLYEYTAIYFFVRRYRFNPISKAPVDNTNMVQMDLEVLREIQDEMCRLGTALTG